MKGIKDTSSKTFRQLLGNGLTYIIPKFQRDYSWDIEQLEDLWQDIQALRDPTIRDSDDHYMGYLVLQSNNNKNFQVIDGQQRLITLSIIILTVLKSLKKLEDSNIEAEQNKRRREALHNGYIGYLDPVTLISSNKLTLNRNNERFYSSYLVTLQKLPQRDLNSSERLMKNCFEWFERKIDESLKTGEELAKFVDDIVDKLCFTVIDVDDEVNAFRVFETLNARGVQLSSADLLKNYLFSIVDANKPHESEIRELENLWIEIIDKLNDVKLPEFLRIYWNSHYKTKRKNELFKAIRDKIKTKEDTFKLVRNLRETADIYIALCDPYDEMWKTKKTEREIRKCLEELRLFNVKQPLPLLLAAHEHLSESKFTKILKACSVISFRYNVIGGLNPNIQEEFYNELALKTRQDKTFDLSQFTSINPKDEKFEVSFADKEFKQIGRNSKIARYVLIKIEEYLTHTKFEDSGEANTIEHILPQQSNNEWLSISDNEKDRCIYRLGNLTLLENKFNKDIGNKSFAEKLKVYKQSNFKITQKIAEEYLQNSHWGEHEITKRQEQMAKYAKEIWKLSL